jgi:hypothetical protein
MLPVMIAVTFMIMRSVVITVVVMMSCAGTLGLAFAGIHHSIMAVTHHVAHHLAHPLVAVIRLVHAPHSKTGSE